MKSCIGTRIFPLKNHNCFRTDAWDRSYPADSAAIRGLLEQPQMVELNLAASPLGSTTSASLLHLHMSGILEQFLTDLILAVKHRAPTWQHTEASWGGAGLATCLVGVYAVLSV